MRFILLLRGLVVKKVICSTIYGQCGGRSWLFFEMLLIHFLNTILCMFVIATKLTRLSDHVFKVFCIFAELFLSLNMTSLKYRHGTSSHLFFVAASGAKALLLFLVLLGCSVVFGASAPLLSNVILHGVIGCEKLHNFCIGTFDHIWFVPEFHNLFFTCGLVCTIFYFM
jgi:hypothetical protein